MAEDFYELEISEQARIALSSLGPDDRNRATAWFDHLRNWNNDDFVREHSEQIDARESTYLFRTSSDIAIAFKIVDQRIIVLSLFRPETFRAFQSMSGARAS